MQGRAYTIRYKLDGIYSDEQEYITYGTSAADAYEQAMFELDTKGIHPWGAYVEGYTPNKVGAKHHTFTKNLYGKAY